MSDTRRWFHVEVDVYARDEREAMNLILGNQPRSPWMDNFGATQLPDTKAPVGGSWGTKP